ncbi:hypothetical protein [Phenylobacterium aquaticum]|uniref:hypothetical protein n=1 Tax=Phenylobacterium aquaticum TaxID=1763816 RepID=UPI0026F3032D|nr:hypothetical protein [Phenylobacterium aquaticum]
MPLVLGTLSVNPIIDEDLASGLNAALLRAVDADGISFEFGDWATTADGSAALFLIDSLYLAVVAAITEGRESRFSCLHGTAEGNVSPAGPSRLRIVTARQTSHVSAFQLLAGLVDAMMEIAEFLALNGYGEAASTYIVGGICDAEKRRPPE